MNLHSYKQLQMLGHNRHRRVGFGDAGSVASGMSSLYAAASANPTPDVNGDGYYNDVVTAAQAMGNAVVNTAGLAGDINSTYGSATLPYTGQAFTINGQLSAVNYSTASLADAQKALGYLMAMYNAYANGIATAQGGSGQSSALQTAAQAAVNAINGDSNYCASVSQNGTAVNVAVHNFKNAWNASGQGAQLAHNGLYDAACAAAIASVLGSSPTACAGGITPPTPPSPPTPPAPPAPPASTSSSGSNAGLIIAGVVAAAGVGGAVYYARKKKRARGRR